MSKAIENIIWHPSPNFDERDTDTPVDMLVLHYTGMKTGAEAIERLCDPDAKVSAHYVVEEDGRIFALVKEEMRAWHAGVSSWRGSQNINARSIGIEIVNPGHEFGCRAFPKVQMDAVTALAAHIVARHPIPARNVVGHSDVAPHRKEDPGELFDWQELARCGVGLWVRGKSSSHHKIAPLASNDKGSAVSDLQGALKEFGYDLPQDGHYGAELAGVICAFQRHWRPSKVDGVADEQTQEIIYALLEEVRRLT